MSLIEKEAISIVQRLRSFGHEAFFVGGCVRDRLLGLELHDIDITTSAPPEEVAKIFPKTLNVGAKFGVMVVLQNKFQFEVATFRNDGAYIDGRRPTSVNFSTAKEDVNRRDFTVNGLLFDPIKNEIIDFVNGQEDLRQKLIRAIGDPYQRFKEDHLRMLRAIRFATRFDFALEKETYHAITELKQSLLQISKERITNEISKMLQLPQKLNGVNLLIETGVFAVIFEPLQTPTTTNTICFLTNFKNITLTSFLWLLTAEIASNGNTILLQPSTSFAQKVVILTQKCLCLSNQQIKEIENLQLAIIDLEKFPTYSDAQKIRFFLNPEFQNALYIHAHQLATNHQEADSFTTSMSKQHENLVLKKDISKLPEPLLNGNELMSLKIKPGPILKEIKENLIDLQLEEKIKTKEEAIAIVLKNYKDIIQ